MPTNRRRRSRPPALALTQFQRDWMLDKNPEPVTREDLWWRTVERCLSYLPTSLVSLWEEHGDEIVREFVQTSPGRRPSVWWELSAPAPLPEGETEAAFLHRHGLLTDDEERRLGLRP